MASMGDRPALEDAHPVGPAALQELEAQASLPRACFGHYANDLSVARQRLPHRVVQRLEIRPAANEPRQSSRPGDVEMRLGGARLDETMDARRLRHTLDLTFAEILQHEIPADQRGGRSAQETRALLSDGLHALRQTDRVADRGVLHPQVVTDRTNHHLT